MFLKLFSPSRLSGHNIPGEGDSPSFQIVTASLPAYEFTTYTSPRNQHATSHGGYA